MDFNDSEKIEVKALQQRHAHLASISIEKKCEFDSNQIYNFDEPKEKE